MIIDTSALVAVVLREPGYDVLLDKLVRRLVGAGIGAPTVAELGIVLSARLAADARPVVAGLLSQLDIEEVPFSEAHWRTAVEAFWRYGRGRHPAALNFGDCLSYAVARVADAPLLFVGDDFSRTDLTAA